MVADDGALLAEQWLSRGEDKWRSRGEEQVSLDKEVKK